MEKRQESWSESIAEVDDNKTWYVAMYGWFNLLLYYLQSRACKLDTYILNL